MKKIMLLIIVVISFISGCSNSDKVNESEYLYDYESIYAYKDIEMDNKKLEEIANLLLSKSDLDVDQAEWNEDIIYISYQMELSEDNPKYTVDHQKIAQDTILLFALFPKLEYVSIDYVQADYAFASTLRKEQSEEIFGADIDTYNVYAQGFSDEFIKKLEELEYKQDIMDTVDYEHAILGIT